MWVGTLRPVTSLVLLCADGSPRSLSALRSGLALLGSHVEPVVVTVVHEPDLMAVTGTGFATVTDTPLDGTVDDAVRATDVVITMGCGDACPIFPGKRYENWELPDPAGQSVDAVRPIRDEIEQRVRVLLAQLKVPVGG